MREIYSSTAFTLLNAFGICLLAIVLAFPAIIYAQEGKPASAQSLAPAKPAKVETKVESKADDKSEQKKREELSKKLERRREELQSTPVNSVSSQSAGGRAVKQQDATGEATRDSKAKEKK